MPKYRFCSILTLRILVNAAERYLRLGDSLGDASVLSLLVQLLDALLVGSSLHASLLHGSLLLSNAGLLVAQHAVSDQTLDLGSLIALVAVVLEGAAHHEVTHVVLLGQTEQLADVASSLGSKAAGLGGGLVSESGDLLLALLHDHEVQHADISTHNASSHGLSLSLTLHMTFGTQRTQRDRPSSPKGNTYITTSSVAGASVGEQQAHTVVAQDTLLHGESLLIVSSSNATNHPTPMGKRTGRCNP